MIFEGRRALLYLGKRSNELLNLRIVFKMDCKTALAGSCLPDADIARKILLESTYGILAAF